MTVLLVGATGATGRLLLQQLINKGHTVKAVVRSADRLPSEYQNHDNVIVIPGTVLEMEASRLQEIVSDCHAIASCLGHTINFKGLFGKPRRLVTKTVQRLCEAVSANQTLHSVENDQDHPLRFVLMNTAGNSNRNLNEPLTTGEKIVLFLLRNLLPPHADNEDAADYLRVRWPSGNPSLQWAAVRPDTLQNEDTVTQYTLHDSPTHSAIFNAGQTSRINVAHFMAELISDDSLWNEWAGQMPVIYNKNS